MGRWQGDFTFQLWWRAGRWQSIVEGGAPKAKAIFRGQFVIMWMKGRQTILGVGCTRCMLYSVSTYDHDMENRDKWLHFVFCNDGRVVDEKERDGRWRWRWERCGGHEQISEIRGPTCLIGFRRPRISDSTCKIGTVTCCIGDGKLTHTRNSLKSQFLMIISPIPPHISLPCSQLYHHLRTLC